MKKVEKRLSDEEARHFGFPVKEQRKSRKGNPKYNLTLDQVESLNYLRAKKDVSLKGESVLEDSEGNAKLVWKKRDYSLEKRLESLKAVTDELKRSIKPTPPSQGPVVNLNSKLLNQYTLTDYHLGMMAWGEETGADWDLKIGEDVMIEYFRYAIEKSPNATNAIFAQLGDFLHWDGMDAVTPQNRHLLDADTRFTKLVRVAIRIIRKVISMLLAKYNDVTVIMAEGNHDMASSIWLRELLNVFYSDEPRVHIDTNPDPYYCYQWGKVGLFYHHGHKRYLKDIDKVFAAKFRKVFGECEHLYAHTGHLHHQKMVETLLMIIEQHRTLAAKDAYASRGGWMSGRDSKVITYHKDYGEVDRRTINIKAIMDALGQE